MGEYFLLLENILWILTSLENRGNLVISIVRLPKMRREPGRAVFSSVPAVGTCMSASASAPSYQPLNGEVNKEQYQKLVSDANHWATWIANYDEPVFFVIVLEQSWWTISKINYILIFMEILNKKQIHPRKSLFADKLQWEKTDKFSESSTIDKNWGHYLLWKSYIKQIYILSQSNN